MPEPPPYPIILGVTGHRDIAPSAVPALRAAVREVLRGLHATFGAALHLMTALADGADQLVAVVAKEPALSLPLVAVSPMPLARYRATLANPAPFDQFWNGAALRLELPAITAAGEDDLHYEQLGVLLARRCHLLLALWNGQPSRRSRGGTAAVVRMRQEGEHTATWFRGSRLFAGPFSWLDLSSGGPVVQVVTPRRTAGGVVLVAGQLDAQAGDCFLLPGSRDDPGARPTAVRPGEILAALGRQARDEFAQIMRLNQRIGAFRGPCRRVFARQLNYRRGPGVADPPGAAGAHLARLRQWQAAADTAAQFYQRRLFGQFVPAASWRGILANGWQCVHQLRRPPQLGVLFAFAAAVPVAVALFESYAHLGRSPWALLCYLAVFGGSYALYHLYVRHHELQNRFQDYRALAEAMRVQVFWAAAAIPAAVADNYLRKQSGELGWIRSALHGPALWAAALALTLGETPLRDLVTKGWIEDQLRYFGPPGARDGKARLHERAALRGKRWAKWFLWGGLAVSAVLAGIELLKLILGVHGPHPQGGWHAVEWAQERLLVLAATAPAVAAFFTVSVGLRAYEAHAHSYAMMGRIFDRALRMAAIADDAGFQAIVRELGREALTENAEWLLDHRHRPIEYQ